jgi:hypothetical protein
MTTDDEVSCNQLTDCLTSYAARRQSLKKCSTIAHVIQTSLHLYALFIDVDCVFIDISSSMSYAPGICLHYTRFYY